jgi:hypothetical protein
VAWDAGAATVDVGRCRPFDADLAEQADGRFQDRGRVNPGRRTAIDRI